MRIIKLRWARRLLSAPNPRRSCFLAGAIAIVLFNSQLAHAQTLKLAVTSGGKTVTKVPYGSTVTLTVTGGSGQVVFCNGAVAACTGSYQLGTATVTKGKAALSFVPLAGCNSYSAYVAGAKATKFSSPETLVVTIPSPGSKQATTNAITASGSASSYELTGTVVGYVNVAKAGGIGAGPTGTLSLLDTSAGKTVTSTATLGKAIEAQSWAACEAPPVDSEPQGIAAGDFNGDGITDLAVANLFGPTVNILLGKGDGTFTEAQDLKTPGTFPVGVATGDFGGTNGDLVVANGLATSPQASFYVNDGKGSFKLKKNIPLPGTPAQPAVAPDGSFVALVNCSNTGQVSFLNAAKGYAVAQSVPVGANPNGVVAMSFGAVVTQFNTQGTITVIKGSLGSFKVAKTYPTGKGPVGIAAGDFKSSGTARDLAVANYEDDTVSIFYGDGSGEFAAGPVLKAGQGPFGVVTGDFNGDGKTDIAVANKTDNTVSVMFGKGSGTFEPQVTLSTGMAPAIAAVGNFSGHGSVDLAVGNSADNTVSVLLSRRLPRPRCRRARSSPTGSGAHVLKASYPETITLPPAFPPQPALLCRRRRRQLRSSRRLRERSPRRSP